MSDQKAGIQAFCLRSIYVFLTRIMLRSSFFSTCQPVPAERPSKAPTRCGGSSPGLASGGEPTGSALGTTILLLVRREQTSRQLWIGTSGWHYKHWRGCFYPEEFKSSQYLGWYIRHFNTVEINNCFYRLPTASAVENWRTETPPGFCFAVKGSRYLTHMKRLLNAEEGLKTYLDRMELLAEKLGPVLFQLPPNWRVNVERLGEFLNLLRARRHQYVFEFRDPSWYVEPVYELLRDHNAGLCIHDWGAQQSPRQLTADFTYVRFHGTTGRYGGDYPDEMLEQWADQICQWVPRLRGIYVYFNNDQGGFAIKNARTLQTLLHRDEQQRCA